MPPPAPLAPTQVERYHAGTGNQTLFVNIQLCHRSEPIRRSFSGLAGQAP